MKINYHGSIADYLASITEQYSSGTESESFVHHHGTAFVPPKQPHVPLGPIKQCYRNAAELAFGRPDLFYVEGYARMGDQGIPLVFEHAWCCDTQGVVVDSTWRTAGSEYFGVCFKTSFVRQFTLKTGCWGLLDRQYLGRLKAMPSRRWQHPQFQTKTISNR